MNYNENYETDEMYDSDESMYDSDESIYDSDESYESSYDSDESYFDSDESMYDSDESFAAMMGKRFGRNTAPRMNIPNYGRQVKFPAKSPTATLQTPKGSAQVKLPKNVITSNTLKPALTNIGKDMQKNTKAVMDVSKMIDRIQKRMDNQMKAFERRMAAQNQKTDQRISSLYQTDLISKLFPPTLNKVKISEFQDKEGKKIEKLGNISLGKIKKLVDGVEKEEEHPLNGKDLSEVLDSLKVTPSHNSLMDLLPAGLMFVAGGGLNTLGRDNVNLPLILAAAGAFALPKFLNDKKDDKSDDVKLGDFTPALIVLGLLTIPAFFSNIGSKPKAKK